MTQTVIDINGTPHKVEPTEVLSFDVLAKSVGQRRFVLASNDGDLFDPTNTNNKIKERDRERGGQFWRLRSCSLECYANYVAFLRSKNRTPYLVAERRYRNDF